MNLFRSIVVASLVLVAGQARAGRCPNVMLVLDRSGSMQEDPSGKTPKDPATSKWGLLQAAVKKIIGAYGDQLPFGLEMFTSSGFSDAECYADAQIDVEPAHDTGKSIVSKVLIAKPDSGTNTGEAIKRAAVDPAMNDASRANYIILITDGDPNCNGNDFPSAQFTIDEIDNAASAGIHTFVVGFDGSGGVNPKNLNQMATTGLEPQTGCNGGNKPCYYSASNAQALNDALAQIVTQVVGGEFGMTMCDDSCAALGCPDGQICTTDEINTKPHCAADPCLGAECAPGSFCRDGACIQACLSPCRAGTKCVDGACAPDLCFGVTCDPGSLCSPTTGACIGNQCLDKKCPAPTFCQATSGVCVNDECSHVTCPAMTACVGAGQCEAFYGDGGVTEVARPRGGCDVAPPRDPFTMGPLVILAGLVLAGATVFFVRRRRRDK